MWRASALALDHIIVLVNIEKNLNHDRVVVVAKHLSLDRLLDRLLSGGLDHLCCFPHHLPLDRGRQKTLENNLSDFLQRFVRTVRGTLS